MSILFIGFVVSVQPNEAQLLAQKEIKLAEEAALLEQQQIAKAAGFLSVEEYEEAKSVEMPTKALYDAYLSQQAELKLNEEKRKAEQKRLIAEAEEKRKAEEAEKAKLAAKAEEKRKAEEAEKAKLAAIETVLICQSPKHSTDYTVIALFSETANVIPFSSGGLFDEALKFNAPMSKSISSIKIRIRYYDKGYTINRQNLKLSKARTFRAGGEPFVMGYVDNCRVGSTTDYQKARNVVRKKWTLIKRDGRRQSRMQ